MVTDIGVMADMVAAPQNDVVTDRREGLDRIVLQDEAIVADPALVQDGGVAADIARQPVPEIPGFEIFCSADLIEPGISDGDEEVIRIGRKGRGRLVEGDDRKSGEARLADIGSVHRESDDLSIGVIREVVVSDLGHLADAE
jgi:hypothetical protein